MPLTSTYGRLYILGAEVLKTQHFQQKIGGGYSLQSLPVPTPLYDEM